MSNNKESICNHCKNKCKASQNITFCHNYNNPNKRQIDYRCVICKKKIPKLNKFCLEHLAWKNLLERFFGISGICGSFSSFRDKIKKRGIK